MAEEKESLGSMIARIVSFAVTSIIGAVVFSLLYDALMDRMEGKSSSVLKGFVMRLGAPLAAQQSVSINVEKSGDELIVDLRGICSSVEDVRLESGKLKVKCGEEKELTADVSGLCSQMKDWKFNNGALIVQCA